MVQDFVQIKQQQENRKSQAYIEKQYGLTGHQVAVELFRINGGKSGFYLANLRERKYYYCRLQWEDIKFTLRSLGIGRLDLAI